DGTAIHIVLFRVDAEAVAAVEALARKGFIKFPEVDVVDLQAMTLEKTRNGENRADTHFIGLTAGDGEAAEDAENVGAILFGFLALHEHDSSRTIGKLRGVTGGDVLAFLHLLAVLENGLQRGKAFKRRVRTVAFVLVHRVVDERLFAGFLVHDLHLGLHRHDLIVEETVGLRGGDALLAAERIFVLIFARYIVALGDEFGRLDHGHPQLGLFLHELFFGQAVVVLTAHLHERDRLNACANGNGHAFVDDPASGHGDRLQTRRAETVDRGARRGNGATRPDGRETTDIHASRAFGGAAAHEDVFDLGRLDLCALDSVLDRVASHGRAMGIVEAASASLGTAGTGGRNDDCFSGHGRSPDGLRWLIAGCVRLAGLRKGGLLAL